MYSRAEIKKMIDDYKWMSNVIESQVYDNDSTSVAQYGIEATLPKAKGQTGDKVFIKLHNKSKAWRRNKKLIDKLTFIDDYEEYVSNERNYHILQLLKQGEKHARIMAIMNISSKDTFYKRINEIVNVYIDAQRGEYDEVK